MSFKNDRQRKAVMAKFRNVRNDLFVIGDFNLKKRKTEFIVAERERTRTRINLTTIKKFNNKNIAIKFARKRQMNNPNKIKEEILIQ